VIGLLVADRGCVLVDGEPIADADAERLAALRRRMGYVFQDAALLDWLDVLDNLRLALGENPLSRPGEASLARVRDATARVNLPESALRKRPSELSGGMRKRASVARAIVNAPDVVLYDEPTTGLDPKNVLAIDEVVLRIRAELDAASLVVTHDMASVAAIADRVVLLREGRIRFDGAPSHFFSTADPQVAEFTGAAAAPNNGSESWPAMLADATS
jgi:phospholipid/cholesterol/gamma-HCH transport system ATP-binding protein